MTSGSKSDDAAGAVYDLADARVRRPGESGTKASALARAAAAGLPVLPGFVLATRWCGDRAAVTEAVAAWRRLSDDGRHAVVVRSSSTAEDLAAGSLAGRFTSCVDVRGEAAFVAAVDAVRASAAVVTLDGAGTATDSPMAVLVQRHLDAEAGGVLFGADPVTGDRGLVVAAAPGPPHGLVQGTVAGTRYTLSRLGRRRRVQPSGDGVDLTLRQRAALARLARRAERLFGGPQDVEWAIDGGGRLWMLQSRPITTLASAPARTRRRRRVYGPGPVAETLPGALCRLEADLWAAPLNDGVAEALALGGVAGRRELRRRPPVIVTSTGHVAADLHLLHALPRHRLAALDPRPALKRVRAAWRVGRLRAALPALANDVVRRTDELLASVPPLASLREPELLGVLHESRTALRSLHGHEVLVGLLVSPGAAGVTGASMALRALVNGRAEGLPDDAIIARYPVTLALLTPAIGAPAQLPPTPPAFDLSNASEAQPAAVTREALRLRARWLQELTARAALELGRRLAARALLDDQMDVRRLSLAELDAAVRTGMPARPATSRTTGAPAPLPAAFRLRADGSVEPVAPAGGRHGTGAGGGRGYGPVHQGGGLPPVGSVLVVRSLDPGLASLLPRLAGLVSETGSPLSHLAILARELHVPTAVGVAGALEQLRPGAVVTVDGATGEVVVEQEEEVA